MEYSIDFVDAGARFKENDLIKSCPVCGAKKSRHILNVSLDHSFGNELIKEAIFECYSCESLFYKGDFNIGYLDADEPVSRLGTDHYCLIGAGIDFGIKVLNRVKANSASTLLEIGCGFGYSIHYWSKFLNRLAVGYELASYGASGAKILDIEIKKKYLTVEDISDDKFDIVYSSEVIEHVKNPLEFLVLLKSKMSDEGVCVITTPAAEFVNKSSTKSLVLSALSPGFHEFILSEKAFKELLYKAGFLDVVVERHNERLVSYAVINGKVTDRLVIKPKKWIDEYTNYLKMLTKNDNRVVREGALYRLFKEYVNNANFISAKDCLEELIELIKNNYSFDMNIIFSTQEVAFSLEDFVNRLPPYIGPLFYYMGIFYSKKPEDIKRKLVFFSLSTLLIDNVIKAGPEFAQEAESLRETSRLHYRLALYDNWIYEHNIAIGKSTEPNGDFVSNNSSIRYLSHIGNGQVKQAVFSKIIQNYKLLLSKLF